MTHSHSSLPTSLLKFLENQDEVKTITVPAGITVCQSGEQCESLVIVLQGQLKVYRPAASGRSLTLYYVNENESCILTASCILNAMPFPAFAETVTEVQGLAIPPEKVKQWLQHEPIWQQYMFSLLSQRMASLIELVNALAFHGLDERLASWLSEQISHTDEQKVDPQKIIQTTHQHIAEELASSREVISRLLKEFEQEGWVKLGRGSIQVVKELSLRKF